MGKLGQPKPNDGHLDLGVVFDQTVELLRAKFWIAFFIGAMLLLPLELAYGFIRASLLERLMIDVPGLAEPQVDKDVLSQLQLATQIHVVVSLIVVSVANIAMMRVVASRYLGDSIGVGSALGLGFFHLGDYLVTILLAALLIVLGLIALVIPGLILLFRYSFIIQVVAIEEISGRAALKRSRALMKGNYWTAIMVVIIFLLIGWFSRVAIFVTSIPSIQIVTRSVIQVVMTTLGLIAWTAFYFSARYKLEEQLASTPAAPEGDARETGKEVDQRFDGNERAFD